MNTDDENEKINPDTGTESYDDDAVEELYEDIENDGVDTPNNDVNENVSNNESNNYEARRNAKREQVNNAIDDVAASAVSKIAGVPKPLAKMALNSPFGPGKSPVNNLISHKLRNKIADSIPAPEGEVEVPEEKTEENTEKKTSPLSNAIQGQNDASKDAVTQGIVTGLKALSKHPTFWLVVGIVILIVIVLIILMVYFADESENNSQYFSSNYSEECDGFDFNATPMTREEFIEKVTDYYTNKSSAKDNAKQAFIENADTIYDMSMQNNINPEIVVIRAVAEGHSPSGYYDGEEGKNNYWGIGCTNTGGIVACNGYSSFDEGLEDFLKIIGDKSSLFEMMQKYSSLGSYWYNPGDRGAGGCYYLDSVKPYLDENRYNEVVQICNGSKCSKDDTSNCTKTTEEDRNAYTEYQVSNMLNLREQIFGISREACNSYSSNCTIYAQGDSRWGSILLGKSHADMANYGCAVTALAIGISCSGTPITVENFDAGVFVQELNNSQCFYDNGDINWTCSGIAKVAPGVSIDRDINDTDVSGYTAEQKNAKINSYDPSEYFLILQIKNQHTSSHFVVFDKINGSNYTVKDPGKGKLNDVLINDIKRIMAFRYAKGESENG